jgi:hypothetical protein
MGTSTAITPLALTELTPLSDFALTLRRNGLSQRTDAASFFDGVRNGQAFDLHFDLSQAVALRLGLQEVYRGERYAPAQIAAVLGLTTNLEVPLGYADVPALPMKRVMMFPVNADKLFAALTEVRAHFGTADSHDWERGKLVVHSLGETNLWGGQLSKIKTALTSSINAMTADLPTEVVNPLTGRLQPANLDQYLGQARSKIAMVEVPDFIALCAWEKLCAMAAPERCDKIGLGSLANPFIEPPLPKDTLWHRVCAGLSL